MSTKHEQALHHLRAVLGFREGTTSYQSAVAEADAFNTTAELIVAAIEG